MRIAIMMMNIENRNEPLMCILYFETINQYQTQYPLTKRLTIHVYKILLLDSAYNDCRILDAIT